MSNHRKRPETNDIVVETPQPYDAWAIACLLAGKAIGIDYGRISDAHRDEVRYIAETSFDDRAETWQQYLTYMVPEAEQDAWRVAVAAVNLDDPPLDDDGGQLLVEDDGTARGARCRALPGRCLPIGCAKPDQVCGGIHRMPG